MQRAMCSDLDEVRKKMKRLREDQYEYYKERERSKEEQKELEWDERKNLDRKLSSDLNNHREMVMNLKEKQHKYYKKREKQEKERAEVILQEWKDLDKRRTEIRIFLMEVVLLDLVVWLYYTGLIQQEWFGWWRLGLRIFGFWFD
jgi:hypothetical protein